MSDGFSLNSRVRLKTAPDRQGRITGETQQRAGRVRYQIDFGDGLEFVASGNIELIEDDEDIYSLIARGQYGSVSHLRMAMTHVRLSGRLADVIYSMEASNTEFFAYQFKPVINFLNSPSNGLLIADEVGLGKTIEAGLIWTEMRARFDASRLLIIAPAVLREKWQEELAYRFGVKADICNADELLRRLQQHQRDPRRGFALISSLQGIRPPRGWDREDADGKLNPSAGAKLMRFLAENEINEPLFDCVIIDEAHYLRNPESQSHKLGEQLRLVSDNVILLSATPIQLKAQELFYLLRLIDPQSFQHEFVFDAVLRANEPILKLSGALRGGKLDKSAYLQALQVCIDHPRFEGNRQLAYLAENPPSNEELQDPAIREKLANRVDRINLLAQVVSRTRKRFVNEHKVFRKPVAPFIQMTAMEEEFYNRVTGMVRGYCEHRDLSEGFILTIPQRQMCSSIPAAFRAWTRRIEEDLKLQLYEMGGDAIDDKVTSVAPLIEELANGVSDFADYEQLYEEDSKFKVLCSQLDAYWKDNPDKKVILFSYYKETLRYLNERLTEVGITSQVLYGGMKESKHDAIARFRDNPNTRILLASEVASEGVDLQFASFLINYDLPWNPMRVEQRVGRIDRIGQKEDRILIQNYFYADTLDERIYRRLFDRLDIFRNALGDLEAILGDKVRKLTHYLLSHKMTAADEEEKIDREKKVLAYLKRTQEELEEEAMHFAAHGDYVLNQVRAAREMKRYVQDEHLWIYVHDFLNERYPGCSFVRQDGEHLTVEIELSRDARIDLKVFVERTLPDRRTGLISNTLGSKVRCVFSNHVALVGRGYEVVNQHHPLVRFVTSQLSDDQRYPLIAARVPAMALPEVPPGTYWFVTQRWSTSGARVVERVVYRARDTGGSMLTPEQAERLVSCAVDGGVDGFDRTADLDAAIIRDLYDDMAFQLDDEFQAYADEMKMENEDRIEMMKRSVVEKTAMQVGRIAEVNARLNGPRAKNIIKANEGRIKKLKGNLDVLLGTYEKMRDISSVLHSGMTGVIIVD